MRPNEDVEKASHDIAPAMQVLQDHVIETMQKSMVASRRRRLKGIRIAVLLTVAAGLLQGLIHLPAGAASNTANRVSFSIVVPPAGVASYLTTPSTETGSTYSM